MLFDERFFSYDLFMKEKLLRREFFKRPTISVARDLLGKILVRKIGRREIELMITEVEVYDGFRDKASHASRGRTARNSIMFGPAGIWYVYFTYGMHWMLNIVTREEGYPSAVLIRGGILINKRTLQNFSKTKNLGGPAKLTKFLKINGKLNGLLANKKSGLWIEDRGVKISRAEIKKGPRVGVNYAGAYWAKRKWRFWIENRV